MQINPELQTFHNTCRKVNIAGEFTMMCQLPNQLPRLPGRALNVPVSGGWVPTYY